MELLRDVLHLIGKVPARCRWWKRFAVFVVESDGFFDDQAQFIKHRLFDGPMAPARDEAGGTANVALVFLRPLNDLCVTRAFLHDFVTEYPVHSTSYAYLPTGTFSVHLTISIGWKTGSCEPWDDSASTSWRNEAGPVSGP